MIALDEANSALGSRHPADNFSYGLIDKIPSLENLNGLCII